MAQQAVDTMKITTLFNNMANGGGGDGKPKKKAAKENTDEYFVPDSEGGGGGGTKKRLSIERIYQKKTQLEHILLRPDTYIGSTEAVTQSMWVLDDDHTQMIQRDITFVPGLYKIFDEILVNAADNKQRDPKMNCIKIDIDPEANKIKVWNNGRGIPVVEHKEHEMFVPTMIFGHLLTSSNYDDSEKKVTGGRNGYGAKLCNIFSKKFVVETSYKEYKKSFRQTWTDNMGKTKEPTIGDSKEEDFTAITFFPDLSKFKMETLDKDTVDLFTRRAYDIAASTKGVKVVLNGKRVPVKNFKDYIDLYVKDKVDEMGAPIKVVHEQVNDRWEVAVCLSEKGFQQASFVNSIATTKGGRHIDHVADQMVTKLLDVVKKKNKGGVQIKPFQVKNHMWLFVNCLIENPSFDSQTKENMTLQVKSFGSKCTLTDKFITQMGKCGIIESIQSWMKFKAQAQLNKKCTANKHSKLRGIPKLDDANDAGTKNSSQCTLILTEGDSAKTLAVAGLGVVGRDRYGVFPLRGKVLNVREATHKQIMENAEINNIIKIMGLQFKQKYNTPEALKTLRYGKIMIMTDQDQDGSHIKGLLINFIHHYWPDLLKQNVVVEFITPIVKVTKGKEEKSFFSIPEFDEWKNETSNWNTWKIKYYKGLGTSTSKEAKEYFSDMVRHKIGFQYTGGDDDASIMLAFSKKKVEERKEWLTNYMEERKRRAEMGLPPLYLYSKNTRSITYNDFINRELILFSNMDLERSIPSMVDGLKPGQRKVLFTCFKRNLVNKEIKVAQLAGSVAELSAYHHGENSLMGTIINLAQNFVGSNNLNLLLPIGQFGTRLHGGKDASSPRYIFTALNPLTKLAFNQNDEPLLNFLYDDNQRIEPEWYCPILPMVLLNGADGIGTGWSTKVPNYDIREVVANLKRLLDGEDPLPMLPSYKNFKGSILEIGENKYLNNGEISIIDDDTVEITELPVKTWTQTYKENVIEPMMSGDDKEKALLTDYKEYHTDTTVRFVCKMTPEKLAYCEDQGLHKAFKLQQQLTLMNIVLFDANGCIKKYDGPEQILREFYDVRLELYHKRKMYLEGMLAAESLKLDNIARFILEKIEGTVTIENKKKKDLIDMLVRRGYDSDPVKAWKDTQNKGKMIDEDLNNEAEDDGNDGGPDFNYILSMPLWNLTKEKKDELCGKRDAKAKELSELRKKSPTDLWRDDLEEFLVELDKFEQQEKEDEMGGIKPDKMAKTKGGRSKKMLQEAMPSPHGRRVEPRVDTAIKVKAEKDAIKRLKAKGKKDGNNGNILDFMKMEDDDDSKEPLSLADRLKLKGSPVEAIKGEKKEKKEKKEKAAKADKAPKAKKTLQGSGSPKKKGGKKKNPWSDSEGSASDLSDNDMDGSFLEGVYSREKAEPRRAAAKKVNYMVDSDQEEVLSDNNDDDASPPAPINNKVANNKADDSDDSFKMSDSGDDSDFGPSKKTSKAEKKVPAKKPVAKKAKVFDSSDDDDFPPVDDKPPVHDDDEWLRITGQTPSDKTSQDSMSSSPSKPVSDDASKKVMFDDSSDAESIGKDKENDLLFKPINNIKSKPKEKKPAAEKKPPAEKKKKPVKKKADSDEKPKKAAAAKKKKTDPWSDEDSDDDKPKKKAAIKRAKKKDSDVSEDEFVPKKKKAVSKKKVSDSGSDSGDEDFVSSAAVRAPREGGRARATVKYNFGDSDEEDDMDF